MLLLCNSREASNKLNTFLKTINNINDEHKFSRELDSCVIQDLMALCPNFHEEYQVYDLYNLNNYAWGILTDSAGCELLGVYPKNKHVFHNEHHI